MSISARLQAELNRPSQVLRSTRDFQKRVARTATKGARGTSYASVYDYVTGKAEPPLSFLRPAAKVLDVRLEWLITGEGDRTQSESAWRTPNDSGPGSKTSDDAFKHMGWSDGPRALLHEAWRRYLAGARGDLDESIVWRLGYELASLAAIPEYLWGFRHEMSRQQRDDSRIAMLHALMMAMPEVGEGDPVGTRDRPYKTIHFMLRDPGWSPTSIDQGDIAATPQR